MPLDNISLTPGANTHLEVDTIINLAIDKVNEIDENITGGATGQILKKTNNNNYVYGWVTPLESWTAYAGAVGGDVASNTISYRKDSNGRVSVKGEIVFDSSVSSSTGTLFTFPSGYRPATTYRFVLCTSALQNKILVTVSASGGVTYTYTGTASDLNSEHVAVNIIDFFID